MEESPSCVADGCDDRIVGEATRLERHMQNDGILCELVEVGDGGEQDVGGGGNGSELARADGGEDREERVVVMADRSDLFR